MLRLIDPKGRLGANAKLFAEDGARRLLITTEGSTAAPPRGVEIITLPAEDGNIAPCAIAAALKRAGMAIGDIDLFEVNEAFNSVPIAAHRTLGIDPDIVNVNGSGCSLGHPIAATGVRMVITMLHELRRRGLSTGCVSMCAGGGMGSALVVELL